MLVPGRIARLLGSTQSVLSCVLDSDQTHCPVELVKGTDLRPVYEELKKTTARICRRIVVHEN